MNFLRWLLQVLKSVLTRQKLHLRRLLAILRTYFKFHDKRNPQRPSDKDQRLDDPGNVVTICASLAPYQFSDASRSCHDIPAGRPARLHAVAGPSRRSRSHTPSRSPTSDNITQNVIEPSPTEDQHHVLSSLMPIATTNPSRVSLGDLSHLNISTRHLPPRANTPSIRGSLYAPSLHSQSIHASVRPPTLSYKAPSSSLRAGYDTSRVPSPSLRPASLIAGSHCSIHPPDVPAAELSDSYPDFYPIPPELLERYERAIFVPNEETAYRIEPLTKSFQVEHGHDDWGTLVHPEGARYYFHKTRRVFTDADLCDTDIFQAVKTFLEQLDEFIATRNIQIPENVDLVFDLIRSQEDGKTYCAYYYADHDNKSVFWLDGYDATNFYIWSEVRGVKSASQVGHIIESQYWFHCQLYPTCCVLTTKMVDELRDLLIHAIGDIVTSPVSTAPYNLTDLQQILSLANSIRKNVVTGHTTQGSSPGSTSSLGRFMFVFVRQRFYHFYGEPSARLERDRSVYGALNARRTPLIALLSPLLFFAPDVHLKGLEKIWVDGILNNSVWGSFIDKLTHEWQEFILYATVLLNANVAFLAIQSVDEGSYVPSRTAAQISSYLSVVSSIGSIILGLLLVRQNRSKARETANEALMFLNSQKHNMLGLETLAIMYSLPYALLMWGMVSFLTAFTLMCFVGSSLVVRMLVGSAWMAVACLVLWCIFISWEAKQNGTRRWYWLLLGFWWPLWERVGPPVINKFIRSVPGPWRNRKSLEESDRTVVV